MLDSKKLAPKVGKPKKEEKNSLSPAKPKEAVSTKRLYRVPRVIIEEMKSEYPNKLLVHKNRRAATKLMNDARLPDLTKQLEQNEVNFDDIEVRLEASKTKDQPSESSKERSGSQERSEKPRPLRKTQPRCVTSHGSKTSSRVPSHLSPASSLDRKNTLGISVKHIKHFNIISKLEKARKTLSTQQSFDRQGAKRASDFILSRQVVKKERLVSQSSQQCLQESSSEGSLEKIKLKEINQKMKHKPTHDRVKSTCTKTTPSKIMDKRGTASRNSVDLKSDLISLPNAMSNLKNLRSRRKSSVIPIKRKSQQLDFPTRNMKISIVESQIIQKLEDSHFLPGTHLVSRASRMLSSLSRKRNSSLIPTHTSMVHVKRIYSPTKPINSENKSKSGEQFLSKTMTSQVTTSIERPSRQADAQKKRPNTVNKNRHKPQPRARHQRNSTSAVSRSTQQAIQRLDQLQSKATVNNWCQEFQMQETEDISSKQEIIDVETRTECILPEINNRQQDESESQYTVKYHSQPQCMPGFFSNHIQNLTINAQPNYEMHRFLNDNTVNQRVQSNFLGSSSDGHQGATEFSESQINHQNMQFNQENGQPGLGSEEDKVQISKQEYLYLELLKAKMRQHREVLQIGRQSKTTQMQVEPMEVIECLAQDIVYQDQKFCEEEQMEAYPVDDMQMEEINQNETHEVDELNQEEAFEVQETIQEQEYGDEELRIEVHEEMQGTRQERFTINDIPRMEEDSQMEQPRLNYLCDMDPIIVQKSQLFPSKESSIPPSREGEPAQQMVPSDYKASQHENEGFAYDSILAPTQQDHQSSITDEIQITAQTSTELLNLNKIWLQKEATNPLRVRFSSDGTIFNNSEEQLCYEQAQNYVSKLIDLVMHQPEIMGNNPQLESGPQPEHYYNDEYFWQERTPGFNNGTKKNSTSSLSIQQKSVQHFAVAQPEQAVSKNILNSNRWRKKNTSHRVSIFKDNKLTPAETGYQTLHDYGFMLEQLDNEPLRIKNPEFTMKLLQPKNLNPAIQFSKSTLTVSVFDSDSELIQDKISFIQRMSKLKEMDSIKASKTIREELNNSISHKIKKKPFIKLQTRKSLSFEEMSSVFEESFSDQAEPCSDFEDFKAQNCTKFDTLAVELNQSKRKMNDIKHLILQYQEDFFQQIGNLREIQEKNRKLMTSCMLVKIWNQIQNLISRPDKAKAINRMKQDINIDRLETNPIVSWIDINFKACSILLRKVPDYIQNQTQESQLHKETESDMNQRRKALKQRYTYLALGNTLLVDINSNQGYNIFLCRCPFTNRLKGLKLLWKSVAIQTIYQNMLHEQKIIDLAWNKSHESNSFILMKNTSIFERVQRNHNIFNLKTKTGLLNVYRDIQWKLVEWGINEFQQRVNLINNQQFNTSLNLILNSIQSNAQKRLMKQLTLVKIQFFCLNQLSLKIRIQGNQVDFSFSSKIIRAKKFLKKFSQRNFDNRFESLLQVCNLNWVKEKKALNQIDKNNDNLHKLFVEDQFQDLSLYVKKNFRIVNVLFQQEYAMNLYEIILPEFSDYQLYILLKNLKKMAHITLRLKFANKQKIDRIASIMNRSDSQYEFNRNHSIKSSSCGRRLSTLQQSKLIIQTKAFRDKIVQEENLEEDQESILDSECQSGRKQHLIRSQSLSITENQKAKLQAQQFFLFGHPLSRPHIDAESDWLDETFLHTHLTRRFKRSNAIDRFNNPQKVEVPKDRLKMKDSMSLFYKRVEVILDKSDTDYNDLYKSNFGYKCQVLRISVYSSIFMEILVPTLIKPAQTKIQHYHSFMTSLSHHNILRENKLSPTNLPKKLLEKFQELSQVIKPGSEYKCKKFKKDKYPKRDQGSNLETDSSMAEIEYEDLLSPTESQDEDYKPSISHSNASGIRPSMMSIQHISKLRRKTMINEVKLRISNIAASRQSALEGYRTSLKDENRLSRFSFFGLEPSSKIRGYEMMESEEWRQHATFKNAQMRSQYLKAESLVTLIQEKIEIDNIRDIQDQVKITKFIEEAESVCTDVITNGDLDFSQYKLMLIQVVSQLLPSCLPATQALVSRGEFESHFDLTTQIFDEIKKRMNPSNINTINLLDHTEELEEQLEKTSELDIGNEIKILNQIENKEESNLLKKQKREYLNSLIDKQNKNNKERQDRLSKSLLSQRISNQGSRSVNSSNSRKRVSLQRDFQAVFSALKIIDASSLEESSSTIEKMSQSRKMLVKKRSSGPLNIINEISKQKQVNIQTKLLDIVVDKQKNQEAYYIIDRYKLNCNEIKDKQGNTPLAIACMGSNIEIVKSFLDKGIDPNIQNNDGNTPLHIAIQNNNKRVTDLLLKYEAREDIVNNYGEICWEMFKE